MFSASQQIPRECRRLQVLAERDPRRAVPLARAALARCAPDEVGWAGFTLGWALNCWERFAEAAPLLREAAAGFLAQGRVVGGLRCRFALLLAELHQRPHPELPAQFQALADDCRRSGDEPGWARTQLYHAGLLNILGRPRDAEALLEAAAPALYSAGTLHRARLLRVQAFSLWGHGEQLEAERRLAAAEQLFVAARSPLDLAICQANQAWVALHREELDQAERYYTRAAERFYRLDMPGRRVACVRELGLIHIRRGAYDAALQHTLAALAQFEALGRLREAGTCQLHLGNIYYHTGRWEAALGYYTRAEATFAAVGSLREHLIARRNQAMLHRARGRPDLALPLLAELERQAEQLDYRGELAEIWNVQAGLLAEAGNTRAAQAHYARAAAAFNDAGNTPAAAECDLERGWLALGQNAVAEAERLFRAAAPALEQHAHHRWRIDYGLGRCAAQQAAPADALPHFRAASRTVADLRRRLRSEDASSGLYLQADRMFNEALQLAAGSADLETLLLLGESQRALVLREMLARPLAPSQSADEQADAALRNHLSALLAEPPGEQRDTALDTTLAQYGEAVLRRRHRAPLASPHGELLTIPPVDSSTIRRSLEQRYGNMWSALVYHVCDGELLVLSITPEGSSLDRSPLDGPLRRLIAQASEPRYRFFTYRDLPYATGQSGTPWKTLRDLARRLLPAALQQRLDPQHRLLIVPAGPLHTLPWAALRLEAGWLAERAVVQQVPSLATWQALPRRAPQNPTALLVGCREFGARAPALPAVAAELAAVAARWPEATQLLQDAAATRSALLAHAAGAQRGNRLLHIASHAQLLPSRGLAAHIKLWDGDLFLDEVAALGLRGTLVVLSACDGAAAEQLPGEEAHSLSWAFLAGGAQGVIASLWPVYDAVTEPLMAALYDALRADGDAPLALARAQRAMIERWAEQQEPGTEPLVWSSFVYIGGA